MLQGSESLHAPGAGDTYRSTGMADLTNAPTDPSDEKSTTLCTIPIRNIMIKEGGKSILDRLMRLRRLDVFPGGVIPVHSHENRPAIFFVLSGSITIYSSK